MEWETPKEGQHRERFTFAWLPIECEDGKTRWLCRVRVLEEYKEVCHWDVPIVGVMRWVIVKAYRAEIELGAIP